ncbi:MAG: hypothetical protein Q8Q85_10185 [Gemmatimonadales bacterium]|nr:hypothetical protein [Gemmatimonadales bacterium]
MAERIIAIVPIRGSDEEFRDTPDPLLGGRSLLEYTLSAAQDARRVDRVIVSTDGQTVADVCRSYGADVPFLRPPHLSAPKASVTDVLRHCVEWLRTTEGYDAEWVVKLEITHPFRPRGLIDLVIDTALAQRVDSAFVAYPEIHSYWTLDEAGRPREAGETIDVPRKVRRPFFRDTSGLVAITRAENLLAGRFYGQNIGLIPLQDLFAMVDTHEGAGAGYRERIGFRLAELLAAEYHRQMQRELTA